MPDLRKDSKRPLTNRERLRILWRPEVVATFLVTLVVGVIGVHFTPSPWSGRLQVVPIVLALCAMNWAARPHLERLLADAERE
ncbi:MAG: hypothetical protein ACJ73S_06180 [Mycobacteriales bacterium]